MCACKEIQENWKPKEWDFVLIKRKDELRAGPYIWCVLPTEIADSGVYGPYVEGQKINREYLQYHELIWLPRQSQIQKMFQEEDFIELNHRFQFFWEQEVNSSFYIGSELVNEFYIWNEQNFSAEQLWLAFYMWEKHEKIWDGKKWVTA
jgi:hypothetical protein